MSMDDERKTRWLTIGALGVIAVLVVAGIAVYRTGLQTVEAAPDFTVTSTGYEDGALGNQTTFSLSDYRGKTVLLDFMAVTCTACRQVERTVLEPLHHELGNETDFVIISVDTWADPGSGQITVGQETNERLVQFQQETGHDWRHALDTDQVYLKYSAVSIPKIAVIGPEGQLVREWTGIPALGDVRAVIDDSRAGGAEAGQVFRLDLPPGLLIIGLAAVAGIASIFAPCSVGLLPAYMGFLLQGSQDVSAGRRAAITMRAGLVTGAGIVTVYGALTLVLWALSAMGFNEAVQEALPKLNPIMAVVLIVFGILMLFQVSWDWLAKRMGMGQVDGKRGFYAFGVGYGLAAFGCTGPIFLPVLLAGFLDGVATGFAVFIVYTLAVAGFVFAAAVLVASGHQSRLRSILSKTVVITKISAVLLIGAGLYLLWFDWTAGVL